MEERFYTFECFFEFMLRPEMVQLRVFCTSHPETCLVQWSSVCCLHLNDGPVGHHARLAFSSSCVMCQHPFHSSHTLCYAATLAPAVLDAFASRPGDSRLKRVVAPSASYCRIWRMIEQPRLRTESRKWRPLGSLLGQRQVHTALLHLLTSQEL